MLIGVLSDTHGTLHPRLIPAFREAGVDFILHAGDVDGQLILDQLSAVAEVAAVRGNVDTYGKMAALPEELHHTWDGISVYMTHIGGRPSEWLPTLGDPLPQVAICGHSHIALLEELEGVLFLNPGSAGTRPRFGGSLGAALLRIADGKVSAELIDFGR